MGIPHSKSLDLQVFWISDFTLEVGEGRHKEPPPKKVGKSYLLVHTSKYSQTPNKIGVGWNQNLESQFESVTQMAYE